MSANTRRIVLKERDRDILRLLDRTPATAALILKASSAFQQPFEDLRRVRERMQALQAGGWVRREGLPLVSRQSATWYRLAAEGFRLLYGHDAPLPHRSFFMPMRPSRAEHTLLLAEVVVHTMVAANDSMLSINDYRRENAVVLTLGKETLKPDGSMQLRTTDGRHFNFFLELDNGTEPVRSKSQRESLQRKVRFYERLQDGAIAAWKRGSRNQPPPRFRVLFFLQSAQRQKHLLSLARNLAGNPDRRLCLGVSLPEYLASSSPLRSPLAVDHFGNWQAIVTEAYEASYLREPMRLNLESASLFAMASAT